MFQCCIWLIIKMSSPPIGLDHCAMVHLDRYEKKKEELYNHLEEKIKNMEMNVKNVWSNNATLKNENKSLT